MILNIYTIDINNVGDLYNSPVLYFSELEWCQTQDTLNPITTKPDVIILGGGGICHFDLSFLKDIKCKKIAWGIGTNIHNSKINEHSEILKTFDLVGLRDWPNSYEWVPCVSCMSPLFDNPPEPIYDVIAYDHHHHPQGLPIPTISNKTKRFYKVINFLASGAKVVTSSYHGAYWATLLGREVIVTNPFSSKFYHFKHQPVLTKNWKSKGNKYPEALQECREANINFYKKVLQYL